MSEAKRRSRLINDGPIGEGPVFYWMDRDQRVEDNWALLYALETAQQINRPIAVVFNLETGFLQGGERQHLFKIDGLRQIQHQLDQLNIPFYIQNGHNTEQKLADFLGYFKPGAVVTDFSVLNRQRQWKAHLADQLDCALIEVDAHNIVPCWLASEKQEHAAWTLRRKLMPLLSDFLTDFPNIETVHQQWPEKPPEINWRELSSQMRQARPTGRLQWAKAGPEQAGLQLKSLINRLKTTGYHPNDANRSGQSDLSPYLHYGHISPQRVALTIYNEPDIDRNTRERFLEQMIVRRELSDNFCFYNPDYNDFQGLPEWAQKTLNAHRNDPRPHLYSLKHFENGQTHDELWNACQLDMVHNGKMPGYLRMYWGKKILEWSKDPETALAIATELNDRYEIDGRDPNGYVGIAWCMGGVHDHPWKERPVFGKVRYMTDKACKRQFNVAQYIATVLHNCDN